MHVITNLIRLIPSSYLIPFTDGPTPGVLYEVDVPIMSNQECHDMFKKAGHEKRILDSFLCAGYTEGKKDSCEVYGISPYFSNT